MIVIMAICVMLTMVILSQNPKGGGLSSTFGGGGSQMFGVQRTNDFLDKATWTLAAIIAGMVILSNVMIPREGNNALPDVPIQEQTLPDAPPDNAVDTGAQPSADPATEPANQTAPTE